MDEQPKQEELKNKYFVELAKTGHFDDWKNKDVFYLADAMAEAFLKGMELQRKLEGERKC